MLINAKLCNTATAINVASVECYFCERCYLSMDVSRCIYAVYMYSASLEFFAYCDIA